MIGLFRFNLGRPVSSYYKVRPVFNPGRSTIITKDRPNYITNRKRTREIIAND